MLIFKVKMGTHIEGVRENFGPTDSHCIKAMG